ncbi:unnamed protein product [Prorocentrum cordatum]|uniref:Uncharacterized protein n=1 Tax=Prorocentrum cordatum TaxID=2364126 RepID=A0ABN9RNQ6_9DINO|nr:unnamed protein product [Polarella glacialis]
MHLASAQLCARAPHERHTSGEEAKEEEAGGRRAGDGGAEQGRPCPPSAAAPAGARAPLRGGPAGEGQLPRAGPASGPDPTPCFLEQGPGVEQGPTATAFLTTYMRHLGPGALLATPDAERPRQAHARWRASWRRWPRGGGRLFQRAVEPL